MTPKAVVFDIGNVLLDFTYRRTAEAVHTRCKPGFTVDDVHEILLNPKFFVPFESGKIKGEEFFKGFQQTSCFTGTVEDFLDPFGDIFTEVPEMIAFNERLRARGIPTYILSNTNEYSVRWIKKRFPFFANFTGYVYSHEVGCMKPGVRIYEAVEEMSGCKGPDLFYMDDREENVEAAAARGWRISFHKTPAQTLEIAKSLGL